MSERTPSRQQRRRWIALPELHFALWGLLLNGAWEALQSPLYSDHARGLRYVLRTRLHCTVGDVFVVLGAFWIVSALVHDRSWWIAPRRVSVLIFVALGLAFTVGSEWLATRVRLAWEYAPAMPLVFGLGLSPLLQWVVLPPAIVALVRRSCRPRRSS